MIQVLKNVCYYIPLLYEYKKIIIIKNNHLVTTITVIARNGKREKMEPNQKKNPFKCKHSNNTCFAINQAKSNSLSYIYINIDILSILIK